MKTGYIWSVVYVIAVLIANYFADTFIQFPIFGLLSIGTIVFGVTFTARDYVHVLGRSYVYKMIACAAFFALVMSASIGVPFRIIVASFVTIIIAESVDTEVYHRFLGSSWLARVTISNSASIPLDSILFSLIAFAGIFSVYDITQIVFADVVVKFLVGALVASFRLFGYSKNA